MKTQIVLTGILRDKDLFLIVKRNENDNLYPGAWEFPGGHLKDGETFISFVYILLIYLQFSH